MKYKFTTCFGLFCALAVVQPAGADTIVVSGDADSTKLIPISMTGFSGEVASVLKFDLEVAGFDFNPEKALFFVSGSNNGQVEGHLSDRNKSRLLDRAYTGSSLRLQAHALANDIILAITQKKGIAQTKVAFKVESAGGGEVYVADYDGHNGAAVTQDKSLVAGPTWMPGQRKLFYTSWKSGYPDIYVHDLGSGERRAFARYPGSNFSPSISPDGKKVAMILSKSGSPDLYVCDIDGSNLLQLTRTRDDESSPCWSPDSRTICFVSRYGGRAALFTIPASGGEPHRLRTDGALNATEPDWAPDGKMIIFTAQMGGFQLYTVPPEGGVANLLVAGEDPCWAPNSRTVMFARRQGGRRILSLLDVPTKRVKDVSQISGSCSQPAWAK